MRKNRYLLLPLGALVAALASYGLGSLDPRPSSELEARAVVENPAAQPAVPAEAAAVALGETDTDERIAFWQDRIEANPSSDLHFQYLGELFSLKGRETGDITQYGLATEAFQKAVDLYPGNVVARSGLATTLVTLHQWAEAIEQSKTLLQADPRAIGAVAAIGDASLETGDSDTAIAAFETLRTVAGGPSVDSRFARLAFLRGDTDEAIRILDEAAVAAVDLNRSVEEVAFYRYTAGEYRFSKGDYEGADASYEKALAALPTYYLAIAGRGRVAYARGDLDGAITSYEKAIAIIPKPELLAYLGDLYALKGDAQRAEAQYEAVEFIARLNSTQAQVVNRELALFRANHQRDTTSAVLLARTELEDRKDIFGYDALAWALYRDGQAAVGLPFARQAVALGTRDARLIFHLGMIEIATGSRAAGEAHLRDALALNPAFDPLGVQLAREALAD